MGGSIAARAPAGNHPFGGAAVAGWPIESGRRQPSAWLNWPQIASGCQVIGSPRTRRGACHDVGPAGGQEALEAGLVLGQEPGADAPVRALRDATRVEDRDRIVEPGRDRRAATPRRADDEAAEGAVAGVQDPRRRRARERSRRWPGPRRSHRRRARPSPRGRAARNGRIRAIHRRAGRKPGRLEDPVPGLDLEAEPLVHRLPGGRRDQDERPAAGRLGGVDRGAGQLEPEAAAGASRGATKIVPIQATGPLRLTMPVPTIVAVGVGDERHPGARTNSRCRGRPSRTAR